MPAVLYGVTDEPPKAVLAAIVFVAVYRLVDIAALIRMWQVSRIDFYAAAYRAGSVLLLGILQGVLLAALASIFLLLAGRPSPTSRSSGDFRDRAAIPTAPGTRAWSRWSVSSRSGPKPRALHQCRDDFGGGFEGAAKIV